MVLNEYLTKIKQWWAGMIDRDVGRVIGEQPKPVEQIPVKQPVTTEKPYVRVKGNKKSRPPAQPTKKPKTPRKKKETGDKKVGKRRQKRRRLG